MNVVNTVIDKDGVATDSDLDAELVRERVRIDSYEDDGGRGSLASCADAKGCHTGAPDLLLLQITIHGRTDSPLPDLVETMRAERRQPLGDQISLSTRGPHPDVAAGASDQAGLGRQSIVVVCRFDIGGSVGSTGRRIGDDVVEHGYEDRGNGVFLRYGEASTNVGVLDTRGRKHERKWLEQGETQGETGRTLLHDKRSNEQSDKLGT